MTSKTYSYVRLYVTYTIDILKPKYNKYHVASQFGNGRTEMFLCIRLNIRLPVLLTFYFMYLFIYFISFYKKRLIVSPVAACPREGVLPGLEPDCAGVGRQAEPGYVAGGLAL